MASIYSLSWNKTSFLAKTQLFFKSRKETKRMRQSEVFEKRVEGYSALSSTYYSIAGSAFSQLKASLKLRWLTPINIVGWCFTWFPLATWCYWRMLHLSNQVFSLVGYEMTADQCDVRQSILILRGQYSEAEKCIRTGLTKQITSWTRGLLLIGLSKVFLHQGKESRAKNEIYIALVEAKKAEGEQPQQALRIYRHCIGFINQSDPQHGQKIQDTINELLQKTGAKDQALKMG